MKIHYTEKNTGSNCQPNHRVSTFLTHTGLFMWYWVFSFNPGPGSKYFNLPNPKGLLHILPNFGYLYGIWSIFDPVHGLLSSRPMRSKQQYSYLQQCMLGRPHFDLYIQISPKLKQISTLFFHYDIGFKPLSKFQL